MRFTSIATYAAVFGAGALTVVGVAAFTGGGAPTATQEGSLAGTISAGDSQASESDNADITSIADLRRNTVVTVQGSVERVSDEDEFHISDATGSVKVWTVNSFFTVEPGESVTVRGFVDDDILLEIYAQEIVRADGTVVTIGSYSQ